MKKQEEREDRAAVAWLLLAYSLGHEKQCACEHCAWARAVIAKTGTAAA